MSSGSFGELAPPDPAEAEDVLDIGTSGPRWVARLLRPASERVARVSAGLGALAVAAVLVGALAQTDPGTPAADTGRHDPTHSGRTIAAIRALAAQRFQVADYVRQTSPAGSCATVPVGSAPTSRIERTIHAALPGFTAIDSGRTLDQFTGLCSVIVRETNGRAVVTVSIASPTADPVRGAYTRIETGIASDADGTTKYVRAITPAGWTVLVGATGRRTTLPGVQTLVVLAQESSLTW